MVPITIIYKNRAGTQTIEPSSSTKRLYNIGYLSISTTWARKRELYFSFRFSFWLFLSRFVELEEIVYRGLCVGMRIRLNPRVPDYVRFIHGRWDCGRINNYYTINVYILYTLYYCVISVIRLYTTILLENDSPGPRAIKFRVSYKMCYSIFILCFRHPTLVSRIQSHFTNIVVMNFTLAIPCTVLFVLILL